MRRLLFSACLFLLGVVCLFQASRADDSLLLGVSNAPIVPATGSVSIDALPSPTHCINNTAATSISCSSFLTVGSSSNRALVAVLSIGNRTTSTPSGVSCSWGAQSMTAITGTAVTRVNTQFTYSVEFGLIAPNTGSQTLSCSWTNAGFSYVSAMSFKGVNQTGGATSFPNGGNANGASTGPAITLTGPANGYVLGVSSYWQTQSAISNTTLYADSSGSDENSLANYSTSSGSSITLSFTQATATDWSYSATGIAP